MVEAAKTRITKGTLFEVIVETGKCLPDAVQLLTTCTAGNGRMRICDVGRYALSVYDKHSGEGVRVAMDADRLKGWPEIGNWFLRLRPKHQQDVEQLLGEIEQAGDSIVSVAKVHIRSEYLGKAPKRRIGICPVCREAYPEPDGAICKGCQGEVPYYGLKGPDAKFIDITVGRTNRGSQ
jgi:formylmethanofuran dehydrogenase subunit E